MIRKAKQTDAERIAEIIVYGWRNAYSDLIDEEVLYKELSVIKRYNRLYDILMDEHGYYVYEENGILKGFMLLGNCIENYGNSTTMELVALYVEPNLKRKGIGSCLINECNEIAIKNGKSEIRLWVFEKNHNSRKFYERHGFITNGCTKYLQKYGESEIRYYKTLIK